jgi:TetR/AcrR family transcriptional regulator, cholesterol catabolism regulator
MTMAKIISIKEPARRERKKAEVKQRLYSAAIDLFKTQGYEATTIQQIADAADTAKGTFFNYFPTKEHILAAYHDRMTGEILGRLGSRSFHSAEQAIQTAIAYCANSVKNDLPMGKIILRVMFSSEVLLDKDSQNESRFTEWFRTQIEKGIDSSELRSDLKVEILLSLITAALSSTILEWVLGDQHFDLNRALRAKIGFLFQAAKVSLK